MPDAGFDVYVGDPAVPSPPGERVRESEARMFWPRLAVIILLCILALFFAPGISPKLRPIAVFVLMGWAALDILFASVLTPYIPGRVLAVLWFVADIAALTFVVRFTGGWNSPAYLLFYPAIIAARLRFGRRLTLLYALWAVAAYSSTFFTFLGADPGIKPWLEQVTVFVMRAIAMLLVGVGAVVPRLGEQAERRDREAYEEAQQQVDEAQGAVEHLKTAYRDLVAVQRDTKAALTRLTHLHTVSAAAADVEDPDAGLRAVVDVAQRSCGCLGTAVWLLNTAGDEIRLAEASADARRVLDIDRIRITRDPERKFNHRQLMSLMEEPERIPSYRALMSRAALAHMAFPIRDGVTPLGLIAIYEPDDAARLDRVDMRFMDQLGEEAGAALRVVERGRLLRRRVAELEALHEIGRVIQTAEDPDTFANRILDSLGTIVTYENCTLYVLPRDGGHLEERATRGREVQLMGDVEFEYGNGAPAWVAEKRRHIVVGDLEKDARIYEVGDPAYPVRSYACVPLLSENRVVGALSVSHAEPHMYGDDELRVLSIVASQAAIAIERTLAYRALEQLAITDPLTRAYNRRYFELRLDEELARAQRYGQPLSLIMADVDGFKGINDAHGHPSGDAVLRELVRVLNSSMRRSEMLCRFGGEEFIIMLPQTNVQAAMVVAERMRKTVAGHRFADEHGRVGLSITISVGVASYPDNGRSRGDLLRQVDGAMYAAKRAGKNAVRSAGAQPARPPRPSAAH
jgi:diguanylate cyclase (GGDEF)-like protein